MRMSAACAVGSLILGSIFEIGCASAGDATGNVRADDGGIGASAAELHGQERDDRMRSSNRASSESSPFIVGTWKFIGSDAGTPSVDTEFRFINPTDLTVHLEYAFFELDGTFCGCDRDVLTPNKTVVYTVLGESQIASPVPIPNVPFQFSCTGTSGALKSIVFKNKGERIFLDDTTQVGFQTHAFGGIMESGPAPNFNFLTGTVMTEAGMKGITISDSTLDDVQFIHQQCVTVQGRLVP